MTATSGQKCSELSRSCGPLGSLEKMLLASNIWHSTRCFLTWKPKATKQGRLWFQLAVSMPRTEDTGLPYWPTPTAADSYTGGMKSSQQKPGSRHSLNLADAVVGGQLNPTWVEWLMGFPTGWTELGASEMP